MAKRRSRSLTPNDMYKEWDDVNYAQRLAEKSGDRRAIEAAKDEVRRVYNAMQAERRRSQRNPRGKFFVKTGSHGPGFDSRSWRPADSALRDRFEVTTIPGSMYGITDLTTNDGVSCRTLGECEYWIGEVMKQKPRKNARRGSRRPRRNPTMDAAQFCAALTALTDLHGKAMSCKHGSMGSHSQVFVNFINLPAECVREGRGGGAEAENNRFMAQVSGFAKQLGEPPPTGKVKVETSIALSQFPKPRISLRGKTGTPEAVAKYLADFISKVAAEVPGSFTHANPGKRSSRSPKRTSRRPKKRTSRRAR